EHCWKLSAPSDHEGWKGQRLLSMQVCLGQHAQNQCGAVLGGRRSKVPVGMGCGARAECYGGKPLRVQETNRKTHHRWRVRGLKRASGASASSMDIRSAG